MPQVPYNFLKYYKVIRQYYKSKFKLSQADLDVLLFMYSEGYFTRRKFKRYDKLLPWDKKRFEDLMNRGWFEIFRPREGNKATIYNMTDKGKLLVRDLYRKLNGQDIPVSSTNNPMMLKRKVRYSEKIYKDMIIEMNKANRQQRHQTPE